jgi:hypothetical protein
MKLTERWNRTTLEKARARVITQAAACPSGFGEYAVDTAMHTYSRTPTANRMVIRLTRPGVRDTFRRPLTRAFMESASVCPGGKLARSALDRDDACWVTSRVPTVTGHRLWNSDTQAIVPSLAM